MISNKYRFCHSESAVADEGSRSLMHGILRSLFSLRMTVVVAATFFIAYPALAQVSSNVPGLHLPTTDIRIIISNIIQVALGFLGIIALLIILFAGFTWMTAAGNEEKIEKAKKMLINAVIGLAIILSAWGIVKFVIRSLMGATGGTPLPPGVSAPARVGGGSLGSGPIESHFPMRGASAIARNTRIIITFKEAIDPASLMTTSAKDSQGRDRYFDAIDTNNDGIPEERNFVPGLRLKTSAIQIMKTSDNNGSVRDTGNLSKYVGNVGVTFTDDLRTFVLDPDDLLGSSSQDVSYTVYLCGVQGGSSDRGNCAQGGIKLLNGAPVFSGRFTDYEWSFTTSTIVDITPPRIVSVLPVFDRGRDRDHDNCPQGLWRGLEGVCDRTDKPRNAMIQINFDEPVLPTVASGRTLLPPSSGTIATQGPTIVPGSYQIVQIGVGAVPQYVAGQWNIGNQYTTMEFVSADLCGRNACGQDVFCLPSASPGPDNITVSARAATLARAGEPTSAGLLDGIEDIAGNSLDGNRNGRAQGPGTLALTSFYNLNVPNPLAGDNVRFSFWTSDVIDLIGPVLESIVPDIGRGGVPLAPPILGTFNKPMAATTLNSRNIDLSGSLSTTGEIWDTWWTVGSQNLDEVPPARDGVPAGDGEPEKTRASLMHGGLWERANYDTNMRSEVKDVYQNCFFPSGGPGSTPLPATGSSSSAQSCVPDAVRPFCCNGVKCAPRDVNCTPCGFTD